MMFKKMVWLLQTIYYPLKPCHLVKKLASFELTLHE